MKFSTQLKNIDGNTNAVSAPKGIEILGAKFKNIDEKTKERFGLNYGLQIESLKKGKLQEAGIREGYIILKVNNQSVRSQGDIQMILDHIYNGRDRDKVLYIAGLYPDGRKY